MEDLLNEVSSVKNSQAQHGLEPSSGYAAPPQDAHPIEPQRRIGTPENALKILKSQPRKPEVLDVLKFLDPAGAAETHFNITVPGSEAAQIIHVLVSTTIPDHWNALSIDDGLRSSNKGRRSHQPQRTLLRCLSSVAGIGALVAQLRKLLSSQTTSGPDGKDSGTRVIIRDLLIILSSLLKPHGLLLHIYSDIFDHVQNPVQRQLMWKELVSFLAAGKVLSTAAEAFKFIGDLAYPKSQWMGEGSSYTSWIGTVLSYMASKLQATDTAGWECLASFTGRALTLGYTDRLVGALFSDLLMGEDGQSDKFGLLLDGLRRHEQKKILEAMLHRLEAHYLSQYRDASELSENENQKAATAIGAVSAIVSTLTGERLLLKEQLIDWIVNGVGGNITSISMRRAILATFESEADALQEILRRSIEHFGDKLVILHSPTAAQEANAQIILLAAGYLHRSHPTEFANITRSAPYLSAVSNRLAASSQRARFLGMAVAMACSRLIDPPDKAMKFDLEEMESDEAQWYMELPKVRDHIGSIESLKSLEDLKTPITSHKEKMDSSSKTRGNTKPKPRADNATSKIVSIQEISDESEVEDEDLPMYENPDTDASDSEEDPTLIQRSKPNAPVYIRDLLIYLRDTEHVERYHLGISSAPDLIRRKASFGTEVVENAKDLALVLVGLQDRYNLPRFQELRIQSLVALLTAYPLTMGKWAAHTLFDADLSQPQRSSILIAIGLSARELAGLRDEDAKMLGLPSPAADSSFPSKRLPAKLEDVYSASPKSIDAISKNISQGTLQPLALDAADTVTGPNALKVRTFSSRMEVEKNKKQRESERKQKSMSKDLHKTLSDGFFSPLINEFGLMMYSMSSFSGHNPFLQAHLLSLFLQTITIIFSTLGPNTPNLATLTSDSVTLLVTLHSSPIVVEPVVLTAVLRLFLAIIDSNISSSTTAEERLVTDFATQVMELQEWAGGVFERASKEDEEVRTLAAGIMVKLGEVTERYQGRLLGVNAGFAY